ncbi:MAG: CDP-alcohol phosphatidyltransferase family protein [Deltaproteobacteria bacterium]|nr:CDP-alcohol phosphatidyltransferase family protein [Deltaproteobacteria bacterium]
MKVDPVLGHLLGDLRAGRFRPRAVRRFVREGVRHAIDLAWSLRSLRRSFFVASAIMAAVLVFVGATLSAAFPGGLRPATWIAEGLLFVAVFALTLLQLGLVRAETSREAYERFTFPNVLTLLRLLVVPYLVEALRGVVAGADETAARAVFGLLLVASVTDALDGMLSRLLRQQSDFGRIYDPVVDAVFHSALAVALWSGGAVSHAYLVLVLLRYLLPPVAGSFLYLAGAPFQVKSTFMGKLSSLVLSVFECALAAAFAFSSPTLMTVATAWLEPASVVVAAGTVLFFLGRGVRLIRRAPRKHP